MKLSKWVDKKAGYILILPAVIFIILFSIAPIMGTLRYAFFDMQLNDQSRNDMYMKSNVNISLNQETIDYLNYYLDIDLDFVQKEETITKIDEIKMDLSDLDNFIAEEIATADLRGVVQVSKAKQNALMEKQKLILDSLEELYNMKDEFYSPEDTMAVASEFETSIIKSNFIGGGNFAKVLKDSRIHSTLKFTLVFTIISVLAELILGLALALIMNKSFKGRSLIRTFSLIPWAIPTSVAALMWSYLYNGSSGIISHIFTALGFISSPAAMLNSSTNALWGIIIADVWKTTPYMALLLLGGLQVIPNSLYESSALDGARKWQQFRYITLPLLKPSIFVALLFRTLDAFRVLDLIYVLTGGGPGGSTESLSLYAYKVMFSQTRFGYGSAMVLIMALVVGIITFIYIKALNVDLIGENR
ncbi:ABC transporter permease subunit [Tissierella sp. Yu-01]|uniref:ABC transporter permease subunit n=1 Tax=Tissierella sp. Yu-01 TaxID=3035694 RepID=UPI00240DDEDE|nr:ABC transporter permease subunit [Tissierella sp. Yu-01]WFA07962.1 ABC transporter permease subunit [Tissierella sp. Yu-01]